MKKDILTEKQNQILEIIKSGVSKNGYQPSLRDIATDLNITVSGVRGHLIHCEKKGYIQLTGKGRGIKFLKEI